jgi:peptidoglycan/LPS O-acetylase OafA/YrhL
LYGFAIPDAGSNCGEIHLEFMERNHMAEDFVLQSAPAELTAHRSSLKALTGIRFFAAFYVVVFHSRVSELCFEHGHAAAGNFFRNGFLAVPLFFLLSGFILAYTYEGQIEQQGGYRRFWEARFARIWPVYALSLLLSSVPSFAFPPARIALASLLMVQAWNPFDIGMAGAWNFVCWTLSAEALFYLVFPWLQTWIEQLRARTQTVCVALMLVLCVAVNSGVCSLGYSPINIARHIPLAVCHLPEFFAGVGMGNLFLHRRSQPDSDRIFRRHGLWTWLSAILTIALLCRPIGRWTSLVVVAFAALLFGLAAEKTVLSRFLSTRAILLGGGISYAVYLMQMPVKNWGLMLAHRYNVGTNLRLGLNMALLILIALILFKAVEDPARRLLRSLFAQIERRRRAFTRPTEVPS